MTHPDLLKIALVAGGLFVVLAAIMVGRALMYGHPPFAVTAANPHVTIDVQSAGDRLTAAIRVKTISHADKAADGPAFLAFHDLLAQSFPLVHATLTREIINEYSLLYTWEGADRALPPMLISAHMDVVPVEPGTEDEWRYPPFGGVIADGFIWGRGTLDTKQSLMGVMEAVERLLAQGFAPHRTILLAFGHDEEVGGEHGAGAIARLLAEKRTRLELVLDEGSVITSGIIPGVARPVALVGVTAKGIANIVLTAKGEGGHSARPPKDNAIAKIGRAIADLQAAPMAARLPGSVVEMFEHLGKELPLTIRMALANRWLFEPLILKRLSNGVATNASIRSTITPTIIKGGIKSNVIPQEVTVTLNVRLLPGDTLDDVLQHIAKTTGAIIAAGRLDHPDCTPAPCLVVGATNRRDWEPAPISDTQSRWFRALSQSIGQTFPDTEIAPGMVIGITDSRYYRSLTENIFRFVPVRLKRSDLSRIHGTNERISIADYSRLILFYERLMQNMAGQ